MNVKKKQNSIGINRRQFFQLSANVGLLMAVNPDSVFSQGTRDLVVAIPADLGGWDQDYLAFDLVGLAMFKNCYPYMIDYDVKSAGKALVMDTDNIVPVYAESWESDSKGQVLTLKIS